MVNRKEPCARKALGSEARERRDEASLWFMLVIYDLL